jgi:hypothetical protein
MQTVQNGKNLWKAKKIALFSVFLKKTCYNEARLKKLRSWRDRRLYVLFTDASAPGAVLFFGPLAQTPFMIKT